MTPSDRRDARPASGPAAAPVEAPGAPGVVLVATLAALFAAPSCGDRAGPVWTSSDVAGPLPARAGTCVAPEHGATGARPAQRTHVVRAGESLRSIAAREYGDERFWTEIARANPTAVGRGDTLRLGAVLVLPADVR
jgi:nucleoid-associated protein YgaU